MKVLRRYNPLLLIAILVAVFVYVMNNNTITDAIINFCFGGIVPITGQVLAPDVVMTGASIAIGSIVTIVLITLLVSRIRARHAALLARPAQLEQVIFSREAEKPESKKPSRQLRFSNVRLAPVISTIAYPFKRFGLNVAALFRLAGYGARIGAAVAGRGLRVVGRWLITVVHVCDRFVIKLGHGVMQLLAWLEPYAAAVDTWLELRCRAFVAFIGRRLQRIDAVQLLLGGYRSAKTNIRNLLKTYL